MANAVSGQISYQVLAVPLLLLSPQEIKPGSGYVISSSGRTLNIDVPSIMVIETSSTLRRPSVCLSKSMHKPDFDANLYRNDCFVNAFGIGMSAAGAKIVWWASRTQSSPYSLILTHPLRRSDRSDGRYHHCRMHHVFMGKNYIRYVPA